MNDGGDGGQAPQPCGACKHLRRVCAPACIFAQFFPARGANSETRFAKANETYSVEKMTTLIVTLNNDDTTDTMEARYDLLCQQFKFFHHLRLLRFEDSITNAIRASQLASSSRSSNEPDLKKNANIAEEDWRQEADRLARLFNGGEELPLCVVCEQEGAICGSDCVYAPYFPAADIRAERNFARVEERYGRSGMTDLIESLNTVADDKPAASESSAASLDRLHRMLEFVDFLKQLYLENTDATGGEESSIGNREIERGFDLNKEPTEAEESSLEANND